LYATTAVGADESIDRLLERDRVIVEADVVVHVEPRLGRVAENRVVVVGARAAHIADGAAISL
jgi:hypothetical protein